MGTGESAARGSVTLPSLRLKELSDSSSRYNLMSSRRAPRSSSSSFTPKIFSEASMPIAPGHHQSSLHRDRNVESLLRVNTLRGLLLEGNQGEELRSLCEQEGTGHGQCLAAGIRAGD
jgi:hypothetical protein